ncbi:DNA invertase Pin-like site-specific DNA recombinase [Granulicella aggregans]|uniref:DNA invertase Pin-like site-specific DNA recombinase n=1 Tax=Granulicella aggregans TaxID=474949 RepID=A0A7W8E7T8_9BACT|nr:DNA invertase Pin-like site-specific DNA recombinase [Granulicella aggregans]
MPKVIKPKATPKTDRHPKGQRVGYVRVSSLDQNEHRQLEGMDLDKTFLDKASGKDVKRSQLTAMLDFVREGDSVFCHSMDRLGRNLGDLRNLVDLMTERGISVHFLKEGLTFTGEDAPMANLMLSVMGAVAQFERDLIRERQREGIELAKRAGAYKGRKRKFSPERAAELSRRLAEGEEKASLAREFGVNRATVYRYLGWAAAETASRAKKPRSAKRGRSSSGA